MFDLRDLPPEFYDDPYPTYRALQEHDPVYALPGGGWFLTRYADLDAIYRDTARFTSDKRGEFGPKFGDSPLFEHHTTSLVFNDPPLHTRVRRLIAGALTPRALADMEPALVTLVDGLLDALPHEADLIGGFAAAHPDRGDRQPVGRSACRSWAIAGLVAGDPGGIGADDTGRHTRAWQRRGHRVHGLSARSRGRSQGSPR